MNNMNKIAMVKSILESANGRIFSVDFEKKDGSLRHMVCRTGVTSKLSPKPLEEKLCVNGTTNTVAHKIEYLTVFDMIKKEYRNINTATLRNFKCGDVNINFS